MTIVSGAATALSVLASRMAGLGLFAQAAEGATAAEGNAGTSLLIQHLVAVFIFATIGVFAFAIGIYIFVRLCPFSVRKEIEEDQNTSLAIIMGAVLLGLSIIIAAAIHG